MRRLPSSPDQDTPATYSDDDKKILAVVGINKTVRSILVKKGENGVGHENSSEVSEEHAFSRPPPCAGRYPIRIRQQASHRASSDTAAWMPEEDTEMTSTVRTTCKRKYGEDDYRTDWVDGVGSDSDSEDDPDRRRGSDSDSMDEIMSEESAAAATLAPVRKKQKQGLDETTTCNGEWPARKKPCLQPSFPAISAEANILNASPDASVAVACADTGTDPVAASPMQLNAGAAQASHRGWTPEEDTKLTNSVKTTGKKKYGEEYRTDWGAVTALVPGRTKNQCNSRWHNTLHSKRSVL
jgi:hypothetical protein